MKPSHLIDNVLDYVWLAGFSLMAGIASGLTWGWLAGVAVGVGFLALCGGVHWLMHRLILRSRRTSVPQRTFPPRGRR